MAIVVILSRAFEGSSGRGEVDDGGEGEKIGYDLEQEGMRRELGHVSKI